MPSSVANESQFQRFQSNRSRVSCPSRSPSDCPDSPSVTTPNCDVVEEALAELQLQSQDLRSKELLPIGNGHLVGGNGRRSGWQVKSSKLALNTHNRIRNIVEALKIKPNPEKPMIPLSIGK